MKHETQREMATNALFMGIVFGIIMYFWTRDVAQAVMMALIIMPTLYMGYWASNRISVRMYKRFRPDPPPAEPLEMTSERPEHAQRLRARRRARTRRPARR
jgi:hypothetical protein